MSRVSAGKELFEGFEAAGCCGGNDDDSFAPVGVGVATESASADASTVAAGRPRLLLRAGPRLFGAASGRETFGLSPPPSCCAASAVEDCGLNFAAVDDGAAVDTAEEDDHEEAFAPDGLGSESAARGGRPRVLFLAAMCPSRAEPCAPMVFLSLPFLSASSVGAAVRSFFFFFLPGEDFDGDEDGRIASGSGSDESLLSSPFGRESACTLFGAGFGWASECRRNDGFGFAVEGTVGREGSDARGGLRCCWSVLGEYRK